jgi:hypothetical protein
MIVRYVRVAAALAAQRAALARLPRVMRHLGAIRAARGAATPGVLAHSMQRRWLASSAAAAAAFPRDLTEAEIGSFHRDGYCIVRGMFSKEEAGHLLEAGRNDRLLQEQAFDQEDQDGKSSKLLVWNQPVPANNVFNAVARSPRIVNAATTLLGGEVYHWHSKLMLKEPEVGGAWEWQCVLHAPTRRCPASCLTRRWPAAG